MIKLLLLMMFVFISAHSLKGATLDKEQELMNQLDNVKNPFDDGIPKPVVVTNEQTTTTTTNEDQESKPAEVAEPQVVPVAPPVITLPQLDLQGVIVGEDIHQAIIDDTVVPLHGVIKGAKVISVTKQWVELIYKDKKFFLKVD